MDRDEFAQRYGPWALVLGGSEGVGATFAAEVASRGVDVVLVARRQQALDEVAADLRAEHGIDVRTLALDLTEPDAAERLADATDDVEVGILLYAAGADPSYRRFLDQPVEDAVAMVHRNCVVPLQVCHHYAGPMVARGRGGIILMSSGAAFVGARNLVAYASSKAFDTVMAEALWAELDEVGVDVLGLMLGLTDTPALRRMLVERGQLPDVDTPVPGSTTVEQVVADALANLGGGPTCYAGDDVRMGAEVFGSMSRNDAVRMMIEVGPGVMGEDQT